MLSVGVKISSVIQKAKPKLLCDVAISLLDLGTKEMRSVRRRATCTIVLTAALFSAEGVEPIRVKR